MPETAPAPSPATAPVALRPFSATPTAIHGLFIIEMKEVRDAMAKILDSTTLADLVKRTDILEENKKQGLMYYI